MKSNRIWLEPKGNNCDYIVWYVGDGDAYFAIGDGSAHGSKFSTSLYGISKKEQVEFMKRINKMLTELTKFKEAMK